MAQHPPGDQVGGDKVGRDKVGRDVVYNTTIVQPSAPLTPEERENRRAMLDKVRQIWIEGVLQQSLWQTARLDLPLATQPGAVQQRQRPYPLAAHGPAGDQPLPDGTRIAEVYAAQRGALLILGAPGAGKTTLLLELASTLLDEAQAMLERGEVPLLPVVFNLTSWATKKLSLADWLVSEMNIRYEVPTKIAQRWVDEQTILPLLDGLDEVASDARAACAAAINVYRQEHGGLRPLVVCCRAEEYGHLGTALQLHGAVLALPLRHEQIAHALTVGGERLAGIRAALKRDAVLWELLETPLMLSVVVLAYEGQPASALPRGNHTTMRSILFAHYVERMFNRKADDPRYSHAQTLRWVRWLAQQLRRHNQSIYQIEEMQLDWLAAGTQRRGYRFLSTLAGGLLGGLAGGLVGGLTGGLIFGMFFGLVRWLAGETTFSLDAALTGALIMGLAGVLVGGLVSGLLIWTHRTIEPVDQVQWSWQMMRRRWRSHLGVGLGVGVGIGLLFGLLAMVDDTLIFGLLGGLLFGLGTGLVGGVVLWLRDGFHPINLERRSWPNEGIRRSVRSGLNVGLNLGLVGGLISGLLFGLGIGLINGLFDSLGNGLLSGLGFGLLFGLIFGLGGGLLGGVLSGWRTVIQHYILRLVLWRSGVFPRDIAAFCDYATERILLRRVGGGWIFIHRLLLEYFAELDDDTRGR